KWGSVPPRDKSAAYRGCWRPVPPRCMLAATVSDLLDTLRRTLADRYAVEREIGRGGMATVVLAEDVQHHRPVAIKVRAAALAATAAGAGEHLTQTGTIIGTPAYMSPEQATGRADVDGRSDEYSLACVVYEMLVGEPPFTGPTAQAVIARHSLDLVSPPSIV